MSLPPVRIRVFYPADPLGVVPGGVDTFLRGLIKWAPDDLAFSLVGMSTDLAARPLNRWQRCRIGQREFDFLPVVATHDAGSRGRVPLSLRFSLATRLHMAQVHGGFDVFDFHRIAPSMLFAHDGRPKNAYFHNDPQTLRLAASDNLWRHAPAVYERLERKAMTGFSRVWCVRDSGVQALRQRYPALAASIGFISTWADADVFYPVDAPRRAQLRRARALGHGLDATLPWIVSVGRLDTQKNLALTLGALQQLHAQRRPAHWLVIGDGVLRAELQRQAAAAGLDDHVVFLGLLPPADIADWLRAADVFALSSAYEGMPMALLEALGCGLPAACTDVGEVRRVVRPGVNGAIATSDSSQAFAQALLQVIDGAAQLGGTPAVAAVAAYQPAQVLAPVYDNYRLLGQGTRVLQMAADANRREADGTCDAKHTGNGDGHDDSHDHSHDPSHDGSAPRPRRTAVGIPVDALGRDAVSQRVLGWAQRNESRVVCFVNVHSSVHAARDERHRLALLGSDLNAADGAPIAWTLGVKTRTRQQRVDGPSTMWRLCGEAAAAGIKVGLYGATPATVVALSARLQRTWPDLLLAYAHAPPFRPLEDAEDQAVCADIAAAGVGLLFVGLGCPKQEHWMAAHRGRVPAVMLGVGAAFDFLAGTLARAPLWMRSSGLEWLHRLGQQPQRMGRRYVITNSLFITKTAREITRAIGHVSGHVSGHIGGRPRHAANQPLDAQDRVEAQDTVSEPYAGDLPGAVHDAFHDVRHGAVHHAVRHAVDHVQHGVVHDLAHPAAQQQLAHRVPVAAPALPDTTPRSFRLHNRVSIDAQPFEQLATRIDTQLPADAAYTGSGRLIGFIGSSGGEGTSTVARAYVAATAGRLARRVLLLEADGASDGGRGSGLLQALAAQRPLHMLTRPLVGGGVVASLGAFGVQRNAGELAARPELWQELRRHFDDIVLDLPARRGSAMGLRLASFCDGVVVVLEGGKTRATVAQSLVGELRSVRANVLGTVLNKRRFYVPERIYSWL